MAKGEDRQKNNGSNPAPPSPQREREEKAGFDKKKGQPDKNKKALAKKGAAKPVEKGPSRFQQVKQFFREVRIELKKVSWPSRKEALASTSVVVVLVFITALYLGMCDVVLSRALKILFR